MKRYAFLAAVVLLLFACRGGCRQEPPPQQTCCVPMPTCTPTGNGTASPSAAPTNTRTPIPTRTPEPTATRTQRTATPTKTPTPRPTATPTPRQTAVTIDPVPCDRTASQGIYKHVKDACFKYQNDHPEQWTDGKLAPAYWDTFYFEVVDTLNKGGWVQAVVDNCGGQGICGEIACKLYGTKRGEGFHEQYHVLTSEGKQHCDSTECYRTTCTPAGF